MNPKGTCPSTLCELLLARGKWPDGKWPAFTLKTTSWHRHSRGAAAGVLQLSVSRQGRFGTLTTTRVSDQNQRLHQRPCATAIPSWISGTLGVITVVLGSCVPWKHSDPLLSTSLSLHPMFFRPAVPRSMDLWPHGLWSLCKTWPWLNVLLCS